jgi:N-acetylmuramoyl-L-alanine amidase
MKFRIVWITLCITVFLFTALQVKQGLLSTEVFSGATLKYGAKGQDIIELQGRLKYLGFYNGNVDGDYGYQTLRAVKDFQYKFGMKVDGIVGRKTQVMLWKASKDWSIDRTPPAGSAGGTAGGAAAGQAARGGAASTTLASSNHLGLSSEDLKLMANAVHGEARGEPYVGQVAVAAVILNRVKSPSFPNSVSGVIFQPGAFTAVADGQIWLTPNETSAKAVQDALNGWDPTGGCIYYFNPVTATSKWIWSRPQVKQIGKHIFCM